MARLSFSKAALHHQGTLLKRYRQYLPSLDLKRQQLIAERNKAAAALKHTENQIQKNLDYVREQLPMLADLKIDLNQLVRAGTIERASENIVGIQLPVVKSVQIIRHNYSFLTKPHWVDNTVNQLADMMELEIHRQFARKRLDILDQAVKKVTQRVNLFDKVLIPRTRQNIAKIKIFLSDAERAAVVRAKITKQNRIQARS
jgi:V/A-type H+-transporting ATPase subunit D